MCSSTSSAIQICSPGGSVAPKSCLFVDRGSFVSAKKNIDIRAGIGMGLTNKYQGDLHFYVPYRTVPYRTVPYRTVPYLTAFPFVCPT